MLAKDLEIANPRQRRGRRTLVNGGEKENRNSTMSIGWPGHRFRALMGGKKTQYKKKKIKKKNKKKKSLQRRRWIRGKGRGTKQF